MFAANFLHLLFVITYNDAIIIITKHTPAGHFTPKRIPIFNQLLSFA